MKNHSDVKRRLATVAILAMLTGGLAACAPAAPGEQDEVLPTDFAEPTEPVTITYAGAAYAEEAIQPVLDAFEAAHPNITVEYQSVPFADFNSTLATRLGNSDATLDIFDVDMPRTDAYSARGWLTDVTTVFPDLGGEIDPASIDAATVDDRLLAMPYQTSTNIMYFNKALLSAAGIDFPSADPEDRMTWEDVIDDAEAAQAAGAEYGILFDQVDRYYQLQPLAESAGGGPGASGDGNLTPEVANAGWVDAFTWYGNLFESGLSPRGIAANDTPTVFESGQLAYYVGGPWRMGRFQAVADLDFGVAPFPAFEGGDAATPTGGWSLGINPASENKAAALIFLKFMGLDDGGYAQHLELIPVPPSNLVGAETYWARDIFKEPRAAGAVDLMKYELANTAVVRVQTVGYVEFEDIITKTFSDIINGADAEGALQSANDQLIDAWAKYQQ